MVAGLEDAFLHTDADDGVAVEGLAKGFVPLVELQLLHAFLHGLHIGGGLHVVGDTLEAGRVPHIFLLVLLVVAGQTGLVLGGLVPHEFIADLVEQQSFVVLADEVLHLSILGRQLVSFLVHHGGLGELAARLAHKGVDLSLAETVADAALLHKLQDAFLVKLKGFQLLTGFHQDDMVAVGRLNDTRHLTFFQGEGGIFVLLHQLAALHKGQQTALTGTAGVLAHLLGKLGKVGAGFQGFVDGVDAYLGGILLGLGSLLVEAQQDMGGLHETVGAYLLHGVVIDVVGFFQHIGVGDKGGQHLLVAVLGKLLLERRQGVVLGVEGGGNLQLVVHKQIHILQDVLLVDNAL